MDIERKGLNYSTHEFCGGPDGCGASVAGQNWDDHVRWHQMLEETHAELERELLVLARLVTRKR